MDACSLKNIGTCWEAIFPIRFVSVFRIVVRFGAGNALPSKNGQKMEIVGLKSAPYFLYVLLVC